MSSTPGSYLETEIMTAPPQKLQLMMIEAAIRFCRRAADQWDAQKDDEACESLIRAQKIVTELVGGLNRDKSPELSTKITSVYLFVFRNLMEANVERSRPKLDGALRVLEEERTTWRQVCEKVGASASSENDAAVILAPRTVTSSEATPLAGFTGGAGTIDTPLAGFSIEA
ncbi:MAG: flagellar export chaperone FliS [Pirellulales bacterium]|nr:flagellar export chaperone FliS [Pirellulales bacterium]